MPERKLTFVKPFTPEWDALWDALEAVVGDIDARDPQTEEVWQYMGTVAFPCCPAYQFRHRRWTQDHGAPFGTDRYYLTIHEDGAYILNTSPPPNAPYPARQKTGSIPALRPFQAV